ncbi:SIMPL domain-containing protein [Flavobacterium sp. SOK18b]|uniref:SIMPL domain-containing protein n=1 Tax=Flavobacterium sp. SOK18b TaxID=797900 RepID=UPI0015F8E988|nr:SIMPL domain-containing protein [Flavobacterium sp. SOK18b]
MKKIIVILVFSICSISTFSQTNSGNEIMAQGSSKTKVKPDLAYLRVTIEKENQVEKNAIKELNEEIDKLQKVLFKIGFTEKNIKISDYKVSSNQNDDNKKEYSATNTLSIDFPLNNKVIEAFYQEIQIENIKDLDVEFETKISAELENRVRQKLVQIAIADAKSYAENVANTLNVTINNVKQVSKFSPRDYFTASEKVSEMKFDKTMAASAPNPKTSFDKFEVEEIELEENITIVYEIVKK